MQQLVNIFNTNETFARIESLIHKRFKIMKIKHLLLAGLSLCCINANATLSNLAWDNANEYVDAWEGNGGFGFESWSFIRDFAGGDAGQFLAFKSSNGDLNHITTAPDDKAWGSFANGPGFNQFEAYRGFGSNSLSQVGDVFRLSFEHGGIQSGGAVGFTLRNGNQASSIGDYNANSRFELSFLGGANTYSIFDGSGQVDTGIGFTDAGLHIVFELTSTSTYRLDILNAFNPAINPFSTTGNLSGSGSIDSVSLFNRDAEDANAYFNALSIGRQVPNIAVSAPSSLALFSIAFITLLKRKKISLNS